MIWREGLDFFFKEVEMLEGVRDGGSLTLSIGFDISLRLATGLENALEVDDVFGYWQIGVLVLLQEFQQEMLSMLR